MPTDFSIGKYMGSRICRLFKNIGSRLLAGKCYRVWCYTLMNDELSACVRYALTFHIPVAEESHY